MGAITKGYTFGATELVTNTKLHLLVDDAVMSYNDTVFWEGDIVSWEDELVYYE